MQHLTNARNSVIPAVRRRTTCFALLLLLVVPTTLIAADDLQRIADQSTVELTTIGRKSGQARTVTIWFVHDQGRLYVQAGKDGKTDWYRNLLAKPEVTLRFEGLTVRGTAKPIDDPAETERIHGLFSGKYLSARVMGWFGGGFGHGKVVRIEPLEVEAQ
jgi:deazaflavin-dependent oxidoreductase (nitroreductase family)